VTTRRNRHQRSPGKTSQAYACTRWSLLCLRPPSSDPIKGICPGEFLTDFERKYHLTRKNIRSLLERKILVLQKSWHRYYVAVKSNCEDYFKEYCLYLRKNHPAKKGKKRLPTGKDEMDIFNRQLYPQWFLTKFQA
jgi:hypothetical protein